MKLSSLVGCQMRDVARASLVVMKGRVVKSRYGRADDSLLVIDGQIRILPLKGGSNA